MTVTVIETAIETLSFESSEICDIQHVWSVWLVCYLVFGVVCLVSSGVVFFV